MTTVLPPNSTDRPVQLSVERHRPGRFSTTPGRLRLLSIVSVGAILVLLAVGFTALSSRRDAARSVEDESGPRLVQVQALYQKLADADANASTSLIATGPVSTDIRQQYLDDLEQAAELLAKIGEGTGTSTEARNAVAVIVQSLVRYADDVEAARVNTRLDHPIGATHMRDASRLMRTTILPATLVLYDFAADDLHDDYGRGTSSTQMVWIVVIGLFTLAVLVVAQVYTARRTNRVLNIGLLAASLLVAVVLVWSLLRFNAEQTSLVKAQRNGSDSVQLLSSARILALQAEANANVALAERGTGAAFRDVFVDRMTELCGTQQCKRGLLAYARVVADRTGDADRMARVQEDAAAFWSVANQVIERDDEGAYRDAVDLALGDQTEAARKLDASIQRESGAAQARFDAAAHDARGGFTILAIALTLGLLAAAGLVLVGLQPRIEEYR